MNDKGFSSYVLVSSIIFICILPLILIYTGAFNGAPTLLLIILWMVYPIFIAITGGYCGKAIKKRWIMPIVPILLFVIFWKLLFRDELIWTFLLTHAIAYIMIGYMAMILGKLIYKYLIYNNL